MAARRARIGWQRLSARWRGGVSRAGIGLAVAFLAGAGLGIGTAAAAGSGTQPCTGTGGSRTTTLNVRASGRSRTVVVHTPSGSTGRTAVPLVLNLHGSGSTAIQQATFTGMNATADANGFIVAYPQGAIRDASGYDWNVPGVPLVGNRAVPSGSASDVSFLAQAITFLEQHYCVDSSRVYATGFSGGARLTSQLGCDLSTRIAAIAPVSGLRRPSRCAAIRPVPVIAFHGTADPVDPYGGNGQAYWTYSVPVAAQRWAAQDSCAATPVVTLNASLQVTQYSGCAGGAAVELNSISGAGHTWPGGPPLRRNITRVLGQQSQVPASSLIWSFFQQHPLR